MMKISVSPASRMFERDLVRRLAPLGALDERDHAVQERLAGLLRDLDDDLVGGTRVPPVTALRSPPDSRITGADSPVIADSSTVAMPSITVPSPGIISPASTTTTSPRRSSAAGSRRAVAQARDRVVAHRAQRVGLRLAAALGERLGEVGEDHRQPQPDGHREGEPGRLVAAAERAAADELDQPRDRRDDRADLDDEHHRVADLHARVELRERSDAAPATASSR